MDFIKLFQKVFFLITYPSISSKSIDSYRFDFLNKIFTSFDFKTYTKKLILKAIFHKKKKIKFNQLKIYIDERYKLLSQCLKKTSN
jgi:hypothetical protein